MAKGRRNISIRQDLLNALGLIQNDPFYAHQDIMTFAGMCTDDEIRQHIDACMAGIARQADGRAAA
jgi:hypothetical protein